MLGVSETQISRPSHNFSSGFNRGTVCVASDIEVIRATAGPDPNVEEKMGVWFGQI
jgi:hypothetical protein